MRLSRYVVIVAALTAVGIGMVHLRSRATHAGYRIAEERARQRALLEARARLRFELAQRQTPDRIEPRADRLALELLPPDEGAPPDGGTRMARRR